MTETETYTKQDVYSTCINKMLQENIEVRVEGVTKPHRQGKLLLVNIADFYIYVTLEMPKPRKGKKLKGKKHRVYEIPFPFDFHIKNDNHYILDYRSHKLTKGMGEVGDIIKTLGKPKHKFWNKIKQIK